MSTALLLRGYSYHLRTDWRRCVASQWEHLIRPLRQRYGSLDVILVTYVIADNERDKRELTKQLLTDYEHDLYVSVPSDGRTQRDMATLALDTVIRANAVRHYELVVMTRFDLKFKMCPLDYGVFVPDKVNFLWKEWNERAWADHKRVPDTVHMIPGPLLEAFRTGVITSDGNGKCLHTIWHKIAKVTPTGHDAIHVMNTDQSQYVDSNSDVMPNPVYEIVRV